MRKTREIVRLDRTIPKFFKEKGWMFEENVTGYVVHSPGLMAQQLLEYTFTEALKLNWAISTHDLPMRKNRSASINP